MTYSGANITIRVIGGANSMGPVPLRKFEQMVKEYGYTLDRTASEHKVVDSEGQTLMTFAVKHGKRTKGNEVKPVYVHRFLKLVQG